MIKDKFIDMNTNFNSLEEFSKYLKSLTKKYSQKEIIEKSGIDKNVLYRILNKQNITLDNYYKIINAYPHEINDTVNQKIVSDLPLLGQLIENDKIKTLNLSQPRTVPVPTAFVEAWSPVFGYLVVSSTFYSGFVSIFTAKGLTDETTINDQCINRIVMTYPENDDAKYGVIIKNEKCYQLLHVRERRVILEIPFKNNIKWAKFICLIPFSLMENVPVEYSFNDHDKLHNLEEAMLKPKN